MNIFINIQRILGKKEISMTKVVYLYIRMREREREKREKESIRIFDVKKMNCPGH